MTLERDEGLIQGDFFRQLHQNHQFLHRYLIYVPKKNHKWDEPSFEIAKIRLRKFGIGGTKYMQL